MRIAFTTIFLLISIIGIGQNDRVITFDQYIDIVRENHPVMYQSSLLSDRARSTKRMARGGFDPKLESSWNHKSFDDKNYYSLANGAIKVPTWYGVDLKAGYERNSGQFLNESDVVPSRGLWNAGISVPLGKGLVIDQRRAELKKADIYTSVTEQERLLMENELLYNAAIAYLDWQITIAFRDIALEGQELATIRFEGTRQSYINGDKPAIDTLESFISLQTRTLDFQKATQSVENATIALNNFLWIEGAVPLEIDENAIPERTDVEFLEPETSRITVMQDQWLAQHPELRLYQYKLDEIEIDQRLAKEEIKPDIRIEYNPLLAVANNSLFDQFNPSDYKLGTRVSYPILQRKQRGKIQLNKIKIQDTEYQRSLKTQELNVKLSTYNNNIAQTQTQFVLLEETVDNYESMLQAENRRLQVGESSIFLVNSRESKYLESRYKLVGSLEKIIFNRLTYLLLATRLDEVI